MTTPVLRALAAVLLFAGCAHSSITYLTLSPVPSPRRHALRPGAPLVLDRVGIPPAIDRAFLTAAAGGDTLSVSSTARWSAPLPELIRTVLARDLDARLPHGTVLLPGEPAPAHGARRLAVVIGKFLPDQSGRVTLDADWSVLGPQGDVLRRDSFHLDLPGPRGPGPEAATFSSALGRLADEITASL